MKKKHCLLLLMFLHIVVQERKKTKKMAHPDVFLTCLRRQSLCSDYIKMSVLDEADKMLSMGFKDQIYDIFRLLPSMVLVGVFSATNRLGFL
ncbi:putative RNA helicase [Helianthus annuus]|nr:putative RNA helicase [Helianthus annuus]